MWPPFQPAHVAQRRVPPVRCGRVGRHGRTRGGGRRSRGLDHLRETGRQDLARRHRSDAGERQRVGRCRHPINDVKPSASRPCTAACRPRVLSARRPEVGGVGAAMGSCAGWAGVCCRQRRCRETTLCTASDRLCIRCHRSATWIAAGAPRVAPSNGEVSYSNCWNASGQPPLFAG